MDRSCHLAYSELHSSPLPALETHTSGRGRGREGTDKEIADRKDLVTDEEGKLG